MTNKLFLIIILLTGQAALAQNFNRPIPDSHFPYEFISHTPVTGYYFTGPFKFGTPPNSPFFKSPCPTILDSNGYITWYLQNNAGANSDFKYFEEHSKFSFTRQLAGAVKYMILDLNLNIIDSITNTNNTDNDGHEFIILSNGNYMLGATKDSVMDLSAFTFDGTQGSVTTTVRSYIIQEFDNMHNLVFEWNSIDHIFPTETYDVYGYNVNGFDYAHGNAIDEDVDGNILISFRHLDAVYKIDHSTGNVIWILGGRSSDFTFTNNEKFSGQHDVRRLPNGDVSVFDNTNNQPPPHASRGVQYTLDTLAWTATLNWEYVHSPSFYARAMGNHQVNNNNFHLVNYGLNFRPNPSFVLTNETGNLLAEVYFADSVMNYRSFFYNPPFNFQRPEVTCFNNGTNIQLSAPLGHSNYIWSTGETTSSITISEPDTVQVWVDYGQGMLGSMPIMINDIQTYCISSLVDENQITEPVLIKYIDLLGREVQYPIGGQMYIAVYSNHTQRLKFIPK